MVAAAWHPYCVRMAQEPFSTRVAGSPWRERVDAWITTSLENAGIEVTGPTDQLRIRPWSTQLTVPTDRGLVWFKATCPSMTFEAALQATIARLVPGAVQQPIAIEADEGWMLTLDHGPTLGAQRSPTVEDWKRAVAEAARVQRALAGHRDELLAAGLPDAGPETVPARFERLLEVSEEAPPERTGRISPEVAAELRSRRGELADACALLAESPVPSTWQHGDLHQENLVDTGERIAFFDLGDGMWSHAVEVLCVPYGVVKDAGGIEWDEVARAWCEVWNIEPAHFEELWQASAFTHAVNRAVTWHRALVTATTDEVLEWGDAVEHHLTSMLDA